MSVWNLNAEDLGLPQHRERIYILGVRNSQSGGVKRTKPLVRKCWRKKQVKLARFLRSLKVKPCRETLSRKLSKGGRRNLKWALKELCRSGRALRGMSDDDEVVLDASAGKDFRQIMFNTCPTITRARGSSRSFYLMKQGRLHGWDWIAFTRGFF